MGQYYETFNPPFFMERRYHFNAAAVNDQAYDRDDAAIVRDFTTSLSRLHPLDTSLVTASCADQTLSITGTVAAENILEFIGKLADNVLGVREVHNKLIVKRAGASSSLETTPARDSQPASIPAADISGDLENPSADIRA